MINIETVCFLLVAVGSLALFYYLGFISGRNEAINEVMIWADDDEEEEK